MRWVAKLCLNGMHAYWFWDAGTFFCSIEDSLYRLCGYVVILLLPIKQPFSGAILLPVLSQMLKGRLGQNGVAVLASFTLTYPYRHPLAIDIG